MNFWQTIWPEEKERNILIIIGTVLRLDLSVIPLRKVCASQVITKTPGGLAKVKCVLHDSQQKGFSQSQTNKLTLPKIEAKSKKEF